MQHFQLWKSIETISLSSFSMVGLERHMNFFNRYFFLFTEIITMCLSTLEWIWACETFHAYAFLTDTDLRIFPAKFFRIKAIDEKSVMDNLYSCLIICISLILTVLDIFFPILFSDSCQTYVYIRYSCDQRIQLSRHLMNPRYRYILVIYFVNCAMYALIIFSFLYKHIVFAWKDIFIKFQA